MLLQRDLQKGCSHANQFREIEQGLDPKCPFCREPLPKNQEELNQNYMERAKANDPVALCHMSNKYCSEGDYERAVQYITKAAQLGNANAHYNLSVMYSDGEGVEKRY